MAHPVEKKIEQLLQQGKSKRSILQELGSGQERPQTILFLNNSCVLEKRKKYLYLNLVLVLILSILTVSKLINIYAAGVLGYGLFLDMIIPIIHFYILKQLLRFKKLGYQMVFIVSILALFRSENRIYPFIYLQISMIPMSALLYYYLFPTNEIIRNNPEK